MPPDSAALVPTNGSATPAPVHRLPADGVPALVRLRTLDEVMTLGRVLAQSGFFADTREANQAVVKVLAGAELGFGPIASMNGVQIIKGKVSMGANLIAAAIKRSGRENGGAGRYDFRVTVLDDHACTIVFRERVDGAWEEIGTSTFTEADARRAQTQNMHRFPRNMLYARALTNGARWYTPDVFGGPVYTPDELGAEVDEDGAVVRRADGTPREQMSFVGASVYGGPEPGAATVAEADGYVEVVDAEVVDERTGEVLEEAPDPEHVAAMEAVETAMAEHSLNGYGKRHILASHQAQGLAQLSTRQLKALAENLAKPNAAAGANAAGVITAARAAIDGAAGDGPEAVEKAAEKVRGVVPQYVAEGALRERVLAAIDTAVQQALTPDAGA